MTGLSAEWERPSMIKHWTPSAVSTYVILGRRGFVGDGATATLAPCLSRGLDARLRRRIPSDHARLPRRDPSRAAHAEGAPPKPAAAGSAHEWLRRRHLIH